MYICMMGEYSPTAPSIYTNKISYSHDAVRVQRHTRLQVGFVCTLIDTHLVRCMTRRVGEAINEPLVRPREEVGVTPDRHPRLMPVPESRESGTGVESTSH